MTVDPNGITIESFPQRISSSEARASLEETDDEIEDARIRRDIYYPYDIFTFQTHVSMLLHTNVETVHCGVDLVNGNELLIDSNPEYERRTISSTHVLPREYDHDAAMRIARTYVRDLVNQQFKPLRTPEIESVGRQLAHRLFYIVIIETTDEDTLQYAVDSVLGGYHRIYLSTENK